MTARTELAIRHSITLQSEQRFDGHTWWRSRCSCGKYLSGLHGSPGRAEIAGKAHAKAKNGAT